MRKIKTISRFFIAVALAMALILQPNTPLNVFATNSSESNTTVLADFPFTMDSDNACLFIGFLTNDCTLTEFQIKTSDAYKLLTGTYQGQDKYAKICAFHLFINMSTSQMANKAEQNKQFHYNEIVNYLEKQVPSSSTIGLAESIINERKNHYLDILVEGIDDILSGLFMSSKSVFNVDILFKAYKEVNGSIAKAEKIVDYTMVAINSLGYVFESELAGRYGYFQSYLSNRPTWDSADDEIFQFIMQWNQSAYTVNNWAAKFLDCFSFITKKDSFSNHFDVLDYWAEFTYLLGRYIAEDDLSSNGDMYSWPANGETIIIDKEVEVDSVRFIVEQYSLMLNYEADIPAQTFPKNAGISTSITYSSSDTSVITIDSETGLITPLSSGTAYAYATSSNGCVGACLITVLPFVVDDVVGGYEISGYESSDQTVYIPEHWNNKPIKSIGDSAFRDCTGLTSITLPDSLTSIGDHAFRGCTGLTSINLPNSLTTIGRAAFCGCTGLTSITLPDSLTSIGSSAFYGFTGLTSINLPDSLASIGGGAFWGCTGLTSITLPDSLTSIGDHAFKGCTGLTSISLPNGITSINSEAFGGCTGLTSISLPNGITSINSEAFRGCTSLTSVTFPDSLTYIGEEAFAHCTGLTSVEFGNALTSIGSYAFVGCTGLTSITMPESLTSIGTWAFLDCTGLTSISLPNGITSINSKAFRGCTGLTSITLPESLTSIGDSAFERCTGLTSITIPKNVADIGSGIFAYCNKLETILVDNNNSHYTSVDGILYSRDMKELIACPGAKTIVTIPDSVTSIGDSAFRGCTGLTSITLPNSLTTIDSSAFSDCTGLTSITLPNSLTTIDSSAFSDCTGLTSITLPDSLTYIGDSAFRGCTGLTSITLPDSLTYIGLYAFGRCTGLTSISLPNGITSINFMAFEGCTGLTSITLPDSLTSIGWYAFRGCTGLTSITLPDSLTYIGDSAFRGCTGLTSITLPDSLTDIGGYAFRGCTGLTSISLPDSLTFIGDSVFEGCAGLTTVFYYGTEAEWKEIGIGGSNECLVNASIVFRPALDAAAAGYTVADGLVTGVSASTTASALAANFANGSSVIKLLSANGTAIANSDLVGTGASIQVSDSEGTAYETATVVVNGDCTGDGLTDSTDAMVTKSSIKSQIDLGDCYIKAVDSDGNDVLSSLDYIRLKIAIKQ